MYPFCRPSLFVLLFLITAFSQGQNLLDAINKGSSTEAIALLQSGASPNIQDAYGQSPLMYAVDLMPDLVPELLAYGADVNHVSQAGWTPIAYAIRKGNLVLVRTFVEAGADTSNNRLIRDLLAQHPNGEIEVYLESLQPPPPDQHNLFPWAKFTEAAYQWCGEHIAGYKLIVPDYEIHLVTYGEFGANFDRDDALVQVETFVMVVGEAGFMNRGESVNGVHSYWWSGLNQYQVMVGKTANYFCLFVEPN